ncbi:MAG: T9SS C-terminal target domain-containing protein [Calditrichaeota bacterium]|nr:MAG: T9SS C-terminal target domain-containing protein [Calditrichota bacterium]
MTSHRQTMFGHLRKTLIILGLMTGMAFAGDTAERRSNTHDAKHIRLTFFNYGLWGRISTEHQGLEWPKGSDHEYIGDLSFMVGAEVYRPGGMVFHSVEVADGPRGNNEYNPNDPTDYWGWEPLPGFANPARNLVARSDQPESWPPHWNGWLGIPGYGGIADQEGFYVVDDATDREFLFAYGFRPDSTDTSRYGMGWRVKVHTFQFADHLFQDALIAQYTVHNEGTTFYPTTFLSLICGTTIGGDGDTHDDESAYDRQESLVYSWDQDNQGNTGFSPVGWLGLAFLETPGRDFDGIDNDGDGAGGSGDVIDAGVLSPRVVQVGDPVVIIDYTSYARTVTTMPPTGIRFPFNGRMIEILPGDTLVEYPNGYDDNLNGLIDEITEIPGNGVDDNGNGLVDEENPHWGKKYHNYFTGNGSDNPLLDESRFDFTDNDGDWNAQYDDLGLDGIPNTGDPGEGDGMPTSGVGTGFPGEPHIDLTDPDEADEMGVTSFYHFSPFNRVRLSDDEQLWQISQPGFFHDSLQFVDGDFIVGAGLFPSIPGDSQRIAVALIMGDDLQDIKEKTHRIRGYYRNQFRPVDFPVTASFPVPGSVISGGYTLSIQSDFIDPGLTTSVYASTDFGETYELLVDSLPNPVSYVWQTTAFPDAIFYRLKVVAVTSNNLSFVISDSVFTVNNPGNGAPQVRFHPPLTGREFSGDVNLTWIGGDPDGDSTTVTLFFSQDGGYSWTILADHLPPRGSYLWHSAAYPNTENGVLRLHISDGQLQSDDLFPGDGSTFRLTNPHAALEDSLLLHYRGSADATVEVEVADPAQLNGHVYRLTFTPHDSLPTRYHVYDATDSTSVLSNQPLLFPGVNTSPIFAGMYLQLDDVEDVDVNPSLTGWSNPQINIPYRADLFRVGLAEGTPYPADYQLIFSDHPVDTSAAFQVIGLPPAVPTPVNFTLRNTSEDRSSEFAFWHFDSTTGTTTPQDLVAILEPIHGGQLDLTWMVMLFYPDSITPVLPTVGDTFFLEIFEPFGTRDVYYFSSEPFVVGTEPNSPALPREFHLYPNYPNPFNPTTTIKFDLARKSRVRLEIFDLLGRRVRTLTEGIFLPGNYRLRWDGRTQQGLPAASGIYFYRIIATDPAQPNRKQFMRTRKMILLR